MSIDFFFLQHEKNSPLSPPLLWGHVITDYPPPPFLCTVTYSIICWSSQMEFITACNHLATWCFPHPPGWAILCHSITSNQGVSLSGFPWINSQSNQCLLFHCSTVECLYSNSTNISLLVLSFSPSQLSSLTFLQPHLMEPFLSNLETNFVQNNKLYYNLHQKKKICFQKFIFTFIDVYFWQVHLNYSSTLKLTSWCYQDK